MQRANANSKDHILSTNVTSKYSNQEVLRNALSTAAVFSYGTQLNVKALRLLTIVSTARAIIILMDSIKDKHEI